MSATQNGVIETSSGDLLRYGQCSFVAGTGETAVSNVPVPAKRRYQPGETQMHRWSSPDWTLVDQPDLPAPNLGSVLVDSLDTTPAGGINTGTITSDHDVEITETGKGPILKSPDGNKHRIKVANDGSISTEAC
jgi:hypothetical protein